MSKEYNEAGFEIDGMGEIVYSKAGTPKLKPGMKKLYNVDGLQVDEDGNLVLNNQGEPIKQPEAPGNGPAQPAAPAQEDEDEDEDLIKIAYLGKKNPKVVVFGGEIFSFVKGVALAVPADVAGMLLAKAGDIFVLPGQAPKKGIDHESVQSVFERKKEKKRRKSVEEDTDGATVLEQQE